jgi:hypothetical protein
MAIAATSRAAVTLAAFNLYASASARLKTTRTTKAENIFAYFGSYWLAIWSLGTERRGRSTIAKSMHCFPRALSVAPGQHTARCFSRGLRQSLHDQFSHISDGEERQRHGGRE